MLNYGVAFCRTKCWALGGRNESVGASRSRSAGPCFLSRSLRKQYKSRKVIFTGTLRTQQGLDIGEEITNITVQRSQENGADAEVATSKWRCLGSTVHGPATKDQEGRCALQWMPH